METILVKGGGYNVLSNFSAFKVFYNNQEWETSEHAYQAAKFTDSSLQKIIQETRSPYDAKMLAQEYSDQVRNDWSEVRLDIMKEIVYEKTRQHPYIQKKLSESINADIIEDTDDEYWGRGENGDGQNMLGKIWMEVRSNL